MYGKEAFKLISELDLSDDIRPFNDPIVRQVLEEMQALFAANRTDASSPEMEDLLRRLSHRQSMMAGDASLCLSVQFRHVVLNRNKRCLLAYLHNRMRRLRQMRWEFGSILPAEVTANLMSPEVQWFHSYSKALAVYMKSIGDNHGLNLTMDILPPKALYIEVRCLVDYGKLELDNGQVVNLKKNTCYLLPRAQCEPLVRQGILEHVSS